MYYCLIGGTLAGFLSLLAGYCLGYLHAKKRVVRCVFVRCWYRGSKDAVVFAAGPFRNEAEKKGRLARILACAKDDMEVSVFDGGLIGLAYEAIAASDPPESFFIELRQRLSKFQFRAVSAS